MEVVEDLDVGSKDPDGEIFVLGACNNGRTHDFHNVKMH